MFIPVGIFEKLHQISKNRINIKNICNWMMRRISTGLYNQIHREIYILKLNLSIISTILRVRIDPIV